MKSILLICAAALLVSCASLSNEVAVNESAPMYGWLVGSCLALPKHDIRAPLDFTLVDLAHDKKRTHGILLREAGAEDHCSALLPDRRDVNEASGNAFYVVKLDAPSDLGIGIVGQASAGALLFDHCTTSEGIRFTVMRGRRLLWHDNYYLGYDTEANCTDPVD